jgi:hypothetical protein
LDDVKYSFVPFVLDPLVTYVADDVGFEDKELTLDNMLSYLNLYDGKRPLFVPILWGADSKDIKFLQAGGESFPGYFSFLYNLLYQLDQGNDRIAYKTFLDLTVSDLEYSWDFVNYKLLYKRVMSKNEKCEIYPNICVFAYRFSGIRFGFLSDQAIWRQNFGEASRSFEDVEVYNFPLGASDYKVK